ncbi:MAG: hypothetical protein GC206_13500 [Alphaproteobacteria bacterium]|nr:hypothetical protein [Alphaproteobacteria bacterium]
MAWRWLDAAQTTATNDAGVFAPAGAADLDEEEDVAPFVRFASIEAARAARIAALEAIAAARRAAVAGAADATKLSVYREKYAVAVAALAGDETALDALAPEAAARGETPGELAALVKALGDAWRRAGLAIDAVYQGKKASLLAAETIAAVEALDLERGWP